MSYQAHYNLYKNGVLVGKMTALQIHHYTCEPVKNIYRAATTGNLLNKIYRVEQVKEEKRKVAPAEWQIKFSEEWDKWRLIINPKAKVTHSTQN